MGSPIHFFIPRITITLPDKEIITAYIEGKQEAFDLITDWIRAVVHRRAWMDGISSEDIVADSRVKVFVNLQAGDFRFDSPLKSYVQRIAQYTTIDVLRLRRRAAGYVQEVRSAQPLYHDVVDDVIEKDELAFLLRVVSMLDATCRQVWDMLFSEEVPYKEIAKRLNMSEGAVRIKAFRCKQEAIALRKRFA